MAWRADESQRAFIEKKLEELKRRKEGGSSSVPEEKPVIPEKKVRYSQEKYNHMIRYNVNTM